MTDLDAFVRARLDEHEQTAREAAKWWGDADTPGTAPVWNQVDVGHIWNDQDGAVADEALPHHGAHIAANDPARVLAWVAATRLVVDEHETWLAKRERNDTAMSELTAEIDRQEQTGTWEGAGSPDVRVRAIRREQDYLDAMEPTILRMLYAVAAIWSDHPDHPDPSGRWAT